MELKSAPVIASFTTIGPGCKGSNNLVPALSAVALPVLGKTMVLTFKNALPFAASLLFFGFTPTKLDLKAFGAPGCTLLANPHVILFVPTDANGQWFPNQKFPIPKDVRLLSAVFYNQVLTFDPKANALGLVASNGAKGIIGF